MCAHPGTNMTHPLVSCVLPTSPGGTERAVPHPRESHPARSRRHHRRPAHRLARRNPLASRRPGVLSPRRALRDPGRRRPVLLRVRLRGPREDGRRPPAAGHRLLHQLADRQGRQARLPRLRHPLGQGHPPQLRVRPRRRRQQDLGRRRRARERLDRHDVAGSRRSRDGPGSPLQGAFQPAQQVQEAVPEREDDGVGGRLGRDRRLLRRQRQAGRLRRLLLDGDQRRRLGQPGRDQHLRRLDGRLHQEVRLQRRRHRLRVPDHHEGRGQPARLDPVQRPPGRSGQELRRVDEDPAREARPGVRRRRQALPAQRRRPLVRLSAARHGDLPGPEVPRLRQHHVVRPARRLERVRRPERLPVRRRQGRRTRPGERLLDLAVQRDRLPQHRLGLPLLPRLDAFRPDQHRPAVLHPRLQERAGRNQRPLGQGGLHRLPGLRGADQVRGRRRRHRQPLARPGHQRQGGTGSTPTRRGTRRTWRRAWSATTSRTTDSPRTRS